MLTAKNAHKKDQRQKAQAAKAKARAAAREKAAAEREAEAEQQAVAEEAAQLAAEQAVIKRAAAIADPMVAVNLVIDFSPRNALEEDAVKLAMLVGENRALGEERLRLTAKSNKTAAEQERRELLQARLDVIQAEMDAIRKPYYATTSGRAPQAQPFVSGTDR